MDVFDLDRSLVSDYERFARSFTQIRAPDIKAQVDAIYASRRFWPEPLISINPHFQVGASIDDLVSDGSITPETGCVFRIGGQGITLHLHQTQAFAKAAAGQSFVVTTGTGSGKSLCFFVPIIDRAIRARLAGEAPRTKAIIVYPMNALANSQMSELEKYLSQSGLAENLRPTFARYTGQESEDERQLIRRAKPDILLTNFMMLELLMTRQKETDRDVINAATGLDFLVLDELHTYRGRQGADVAMLIRRVRDRLCREKSPICIGTSATMASEGAEDTRKSAVAAVASRLFGTAIGPDAVVDESLKRATDQSLRLVGLKSVLQRAIDADLPETLTDQELERHPLAVWIELEIGLKDGQQLLRHQPITVEEAASRLELATDRPADRCRAQLQAMLTLMSRPAADRGGVGDRAFLAFKLHRFVSGAGVAYATLRPSGARRVTTDGQRFDPEDAEARLYATHFCRNCGQEFHPVAFVISEGVQQAVPRPIDEAPIENDEGEQLSGYLMPIPANDADFLFSGDPEDYPEEWVEPRPNGATRLKSDRRKQVPRLLRVGPNGQIDEHGEEFWYIPGKFRFCPACKHQPAGQAREINKLAGLSAEGRSSATTLLVSSALRWMNRRESAIDPRKRKLLSFTDNRQDAALQAGHFNDTLFVSLIRAAILAAVRSSGLDGLSEDAFGTAMQIELGFKPESVGRRVEWMLDPEAKGVSQQEASRNMSRVLAYRAWADQRKGWRFTNPNLEETGLIRAKYLSLDDLADDEAAYVGAPDILRNARPAIRKRALSELLETLRGGLAISTEALEQGWIDNLGTASRQTLREPWAIGQQERLRVASALIIDAPKRQNMRVQDELLVIRGGSRSGLAKKLTRAELWGARIKSKDYVDLVNALLEAAESYGLVRSLATSFDVPGWQLAANAIRLVPAIERADARAANPYFAELYAGLADALRSGGEGLFGFEGREHTAQVEPERREWREWRFRWGNDDRKLLSENKALLRQASEPDDFLPVLFCSPTMELGVDISALNAVYLRNVPPTPANYAQRSGRAGRSGQAALVVTYCAAQSPHDQYYFSRPTEMVRGIVRPPALDLANRDLVEAHLHAVWLAEANFALPSDIPGLLDLKQEPLPLLEEVVAGLGNPKVEASAAQAMERVLESIRDELPASAAPWANNRADFAIATARGAFERFSGSFQRWRDLYSGAREQLVEANRRSEQLGLSAAERREAKVQHAQASEQITLLERGSSSGGSDFYSYRYLATQGFLPGYNFPRLPLYAFVPSAGYQGSKGAYLQRARFLAIAEFGPGSLIYHEGRAYRVSKARLPAGLRSAESGLLATTELFVCENCGAAHEKEPERCHVCAAPMGDTHPIRNILRIDNVETQPAERITANDEERQRRGFEIQTLFSWPMRNGSHDVSSAAATDQLGPILRIDFATGTLISRVNKGLRRRKEKTVLGFGIDPVTGRWTGDPDDEADDRTPDGPISQRVVPIVQDQKNAALLRLVGEPPSQVSMATLQHALSRGLDIVFQLEESETLSEPTPSRDARKAILAFEATEGGAGVLGRLLAEPKAFARVAEAALSLMHFENINDAVAAGDPALLTDKPDARCVKGCYRCLLSYYNQPDHELIDRRDRDALGILLRLARSDVSPLASRRPATGSWEVALGNWGVPAPDSKPLNAGDREFQLVWRRHRVVASTSELLEEMRREIEGLGFTILTIESEPGEVVPPELLALLGVKV